MKISFIDPPVPPGQGVPERVFGCTYELHPFPNIFLLYLAAVLEQDGHQVRYKNAPLLGWKEHDFRGFLQRDDSDLYVFYSVYLARQLDLEAVRMLREIKGDRPVVFVGPSPTYAPETYLLDESIIVVRGEAEEVLARLVRSLPALEGIPGITYLRDGKMIAHESAELILDLDRLPLPARHLVRDIRNKYYNPKLGLRPFTAVSTSRGCPFQCTYCVPCSQSFARELDYKKDHPRRKPRVTRRSPESIGEEFRQLAAEGYRAVSFLDDQFLWQEERTVQICEAIQPSGIRWGCLARADRVTPGVLPAMAEAGCHYVDLGIESFDQKVLDDIKKDCDVETQTRAIKMVQDSGIQVKINIMLGSSPLEDRASIEKTLHKVEELRPDAVTFSVCNPFPGTDFYETAKEQGWFIDGDYVPRDVQKESNISLPHLPAAQLEALVRRANRRFYLRPGYVLKHLRGFGTVSDGLLALKALVKKLT